MRPDIAAEAAVWVARLHGPDRSSQMERECLAWQARSTEHRLAFERCTEIWQEVPGVGLRDAFAAASSASAASGNSAWKHRPGRRWALASSLAVLLGLGGLSLNHWLAIGAYSTGVGEQRVVVLEDGTRVSLNTATRLRVDLTPGQRSVNVEAGEALFEVAKDPRRPFVVRVAGSDVVALGTIFTVRFTPRGNDDRDLTVTLIEGQVVVRSTKEPGTGRSAAARQLVLQPGERVRLDTMATDAKQGTPPPRLDRPPVPKVVPWTRGEAVFDDVSLGEAVAEMNRYSRMPIVLVGDAALRGRRVSGQFRTGDSAGFARAVATLHGLVVHEYPDRLEIAPGS